MKCLTLLSVAALSACVRPNSAAMSESAPSTLRFQIRRAETTSPVPAQIILIRGKADTVRKALADTSGRIVLEGIPAGVYRLVVRSIGFKVLTDTFRARAACIALLQIAMSPHYCDLDPNCAEPPSRLTFTPCMRDADEDE